MKSSASFLPVVLDKQLSCSDKGVSLRFRPDTFRNKVTSGVLLEGTNLLSGLRWFCRKEGVSTSLLKDAHVTVNGERIPYKMWSRTVVCKGDHVTCSIPLLGGGGGGGGKNPLNTILSLVVVTLAVVATVLAPYAAPASWGLVSATGVTALGATAGALAGAIVSIGGMMLVNAIAPATQPTLSLGSSAEQETAAKVWSIDGTQNKADPYGCVPIVLGKVRFAPRYASGYYIVLQGNDEYARYLFCVGGWCKVSDIRIGDTPIGNYTGVNYYVYENWKGNQKFKYFNSATSNESYNMLIKHSSGWHTRFTDNGTVAADLLLFFSSGLKHIDSQGNGSSVTVTLQCRWRLEGTETWHYASGTVSTEGGTVSSILLAGQWSGSFKLGVYITDDGTVSLKDGHEIGVVTVTKTTTRSYNSGWSDSYTSETTIERKNGFTGTITVNGISVVVGAGTATVPNTLIYSGQTVTAQRKCVHIAFPSSGRYEIGLYRETEDADRETSTETTLDEVTWGYLLSYRDRSAIVYQGYPMTIIEMQVKASEELSGNINEVNAIFESYAPIPNNSPTNWKYTTTSNPASLALLIATGDNTAHPASWGAMDIQSYYNFYNWCESYHWKYNAVITRKTSAGEILHNVLAAGRGSYALLDGHGVVWDDPNALVEDLITQRNSWNFNTVRSLTKTPIQGLRMRFLNEQKDWQEDERVVYADGYNETNATEIIEFEQDGVTSPDLIYKHGRLRLAEFRLRPEVYTFNVEAESLTLVRGSRFRCTHDVTFWGVGAGRIVKHFYDVEDNPLYITGFELDEYLDISGGQNYGARVRTYTNADVYFSLRTIASSQSTNVFYLESPIGIEVTANKPDIGCLVAIGTTQSVGAVLMVTSISPADDLTATTITAVDAAPEVYDALTGPIPEWDSQITTPSRYMRGVPVIPGFVSIISDESVILKVNGALISRILVNYEISEKKQGYTTYCYYRKSDETAWQKVADVDGEGYIFINNVEDSAVYRLKLVAQSANGVLGEFSEVVSHTVIGKTSPPPNVYGFSGVASNPQGIKLTWDEVNVIDLDHYKVTAPTGEVFTTASESLFVQIYNRYGGLLFEIVAVDTTDHESISPAECSVQVNRPLTPVGTSEILPTGISLVWNNCASTWDIDYYTLYDVTTGERTTVKDRVYSISPRETNTTHSFQMTAVDIFGNSSEQATINIAIPSIQAPEPEIYIDGTQLVVSWAMVVSPFMIDHYEVIDGGNNLVSKIKGTECRFESPVAGNYTYRVRAVDIVGNFSIYGTANFSISAPTTPEPTIVIDAEQMFLSWLAPSSDLPIIGYDVLHQWDEVRPDQQVVTHEDDLGRQDVESIYLPVVSAGLHTYLVRAVDNSGNVSPWGSIDIDIRKPNQPIFHDVAVIDNNAMLYWSEPILTSYPIAYYILYIVEDGISAVRGRIDGLFSAQVETYAGLYTYGVVAVDIAGNQSAMSIITVNINNPPDFNLITDQDSLFNASRTNITLDGVGGMIGPVKANETWNENNARVAALLGGGETASTVTWQAKVGANYTLYLSPEGYDSGSEAVYQETIDVGLLINSSTVTITPTYEVLEGLPLFEWVIEASQDNQTWETITDDGLVGYATNFQYVRYTVSWSGGIVRFSNINFKLSVKHLEDTGTIRCRASDCIDPDTGDLYPEETIGTIVYFNKNFSDIRSIQLEPKERDTGLNPLLIFEDVAYPESFRVMLLNKAGVPIDGYVNWVAKGV